MIIVCDTNVLISGILFGGPPREILRLGNRGGFQIAVSPQLIREAEIVLLRPKFKLAPIQVAGMISLFHETFLMVHPTKRVLVVRSDPKDNMILEAAQAASASFIVSGDGHLLALDEWEGIRILRPADFIREFESDP